ncbi:MAG: recombinase family protein [Mesorhizobium sp.]|uniref:recombinase family protein n=1 Tax=Mesorhizobium sp. TaxID=1871066 RepID=UPI00121BD19F|nr:recombinase family protein [Mesorhizobium sp.]TIM45051.1 MAG: recombinase family protein [Mesorhizobium sp.]
MTHELQSAPQIRAAQYIRMSTEHQRYSIENQALVIAEYAERRGYSIVQTYEDAGKSGLSLRGREGLKRLLADVVTGQQAFSAILVLDVSRWGRFPDADQSAHYEFSVEVRASRWSIAPRCSKTTAAWFPPYSRI